VRRINWCGLLAIEGMAFKPLIRSDHFPYYVVLRTNNREPFTLPLELVWELMSFELYRISILCGAKIHAFTMTPNQVCLLISTPELDLGKTMAEFGRSITRAFNRKSGRSGYLFGSRYKWSMIQSPAQFFHVLKAVYRDPVRARLSDRVENYSFSSLHGLIGNGPLPFPLSFPIPSEFHSLLLVWSHDEFVCWLNQPFSEDEQQLLDKALRRKIFALPRNPRTGAAVTLEPPRINAPHSKK
jgi:putative transposase